MNRTGISEAGMRIMRLLVGYPPQQMNDLIRLTGVTRTAITEQINELIEAGFVEQTIERFQGRGRPHFLYSATMMALKQLFEGNQGVVVPAIWKAVRRYCSPDVVMKICENVAQDIADQFNPRIAATDPKDRLRKFHEIISETRLSQLKDKGNEVSVSKMSCPFISMQDESGTICLIDQLTMSKIIGPSVRRTTCRHHGDGTCCTYTVSDDSPLEVLAD